MNENLQTRINGEITQKLFTDKSGRPIRLEITSSKSASLPPSQLIQEIKIKDDREGVTIQYQQGPITEKAFEQILNWLAGKIEIRLDYTTPESKDRPFIFIEGLHFKSNYPGEIHIKQVSLEEAHKHTSDQLAETNILSVKSPLHVKEAKLPILPLVGLHQALKEAGAYKKIKKEKNRDVLETYLTTDKSMSDLKETAGVKTADAVNHIVHRNLQKIFEYLPPDVQKQYGGSAKEAIKRKASTQLQTPLTSERIKKGIEKRVYTKPTGRPKKIAGQPKTEYSDTHKRHLSEASTRRWERYKEIDKPKGKPAFSEQGLANIKTNSGRRKTKEAQSTPTQEPQQTPVQKEHTIVDLTNPSQER